MYINHIVFTYNNIQQGPVFQHADTFANHQKNKPLITNNQSTGYSDSDSESEWSETETKGNGT